MSGSGMIAARPEGLAVDIEGAAGTSFSADEALQMLRDHRHDYALGILCLAAAKCTEVQSLAASGRIDRDGADLFIRRYSESIAEILAELVPAASKQKGN